MFAEPVQWFVADDDVDDVSESDEEHDFVRTQRDFIKNLGGRRLPRLKQATDFCSDVSDDECDADDPPTDHVSIPVTMYPPPQFAESEPEETKSSGIEVDKNCFVSGGSASSEESVVVTQNKPVNRSSYLFQNLPVRRAYVTGAIIETSKVLSKTVHSRANWFQRPAEVTRASAPDTPCVGKPDERSNMVQAGTSRAKGVVKALVEKSRTLSTNARDKSNRLQAEASLATTKTIDVARGRAQIAKDMVKNKILMFESKSNTDVKEDGKVGERSSFLRGKFSRAKPGGA